MTGRRAQDNKARVFKRREYDRGVPEYADLVVDKRPVAEELARSDAERACLQALREATGARNGPMERHTVRAFLIAERLAAERSRTLDREVLLCAAFLHDVGLFPPASRGGVYVADSRRFIQRVLVPFNWPEGRLRACLDAVELHHVPRPIWGFGAEAELLRRADFIDMTNGLARSGLPGGWLRGLFREVPRDGFYPEFVRLNWLMLRQRPRTIPRIFAPRG